MKHVLKGLVAKSFFMFCSLVVINSSQDVSAQTPQEIAFSNAVLPLPSDMRAKTGIIRWTGNGNFEQLRPSENGFSCSADDPTDEVFDVRCYENDMWHAIARLRQLSDQYETRPEIDKHLEREIREGLVPFPMRPTAGYRMLGPINSIDLATGEVQPAMNDWQSVHFPFRTSEELGLTEADEMRQGEPMPFVMASGRWWSHVMIMHGPWKPLNQ